MMNEQEGGYQKMAKYKIEEIENIEMGEMNKEELDFILQEGECQFIEFKESLGKSFVKELIAFNYAAIHINVEFEIKALRRREIPQYLLEAYGEVIINAVEHRDYFQKSGDIVMEVFRNKMWIWNLEELVKWLNLSKTDFAEKVGSGINRIRNAMKDEGLGEPLFEYNHHFLTTLNDKTGGTGEKTVEKTVEKSVEKSVEKIIQLIKEKPNITQDELSEKIGLSRRGIEWNLEKLKKEGLLRRIGSRKEGYWQVINKEVKNDKL